MKRRIAVLTEGADCLDRFDEYFDFLIGWEGSELENHPKDSGGLTKFGIDQRSHPRVDIAALTLRDAKKIYREEYLASAAVYFPFPLNYAFFDAVVNSGRKRAIQLAQRAVGVEDDGTIGPVTERALLAQFEKNPGTLLMRMIAEREKFYKNLAYVRPKDQAFLKGWLNRADALRKWCGARMKGGK